MALLRVGLTSAKRAIADRNLSSVIAVHSIRKKTQAFCFANSVVSQRRCDKKLKIMTSKAAGEMERR